MVSNFPVVNVRYDVGVNYDISMVLERDSPIQTRVDLLDVSLNVKQEQISRQFMVIHLESFLDYTNYTQAINGLKVVAAASKTT